MRITLPATIHTMDRARMPQIKDIPELLEWLSENGIAYAERSVFPSSVFPTQLFVDDGKALGAIANSTKPLIVDQDFYIIDGHHRWWGAMMTHAKSIEVIVVDHKFSSIVDDLLEIFPPADA